MNFQAENKAVEPAFEPGSLFPVIMFWMGESISRIAVACMNSVISQGHKLTLYCYEQPKNLPAGVTLDDAENVLRKQDFVYFHEKNPAALGSDLFRFHALNKGLGLWLDTDVILLKPLVYDRQDVVFGWEDAETINGAVLYIDRRSILLKSLLAFTDDHYPIPPFLSSEYVNFLRASKEAGRPVHVSRMEWGVWGPLALTHFAKMYNLHRFAARQEAFYPVHWSQAHKLITRGYNIEKNLTKETFAVHLWSTKLSSPSKIRPEITDDRIEIHKGSFVYQFL